MCVVGVVGWGKTTAHTAQSRHGAAAVWLLLLLLLRGKTASSCVPADASCGPQVAAEQTGAQHVQHEVQLPLR